MSALQVVRRYFAAIDAHDFAAVTDLVTHDMRLHATGAPGPLGPNEAVAMLGGFVAAFPDLAHTIEDAVANGDRVAVRLCVEGTHLGDFNGVPPTGRRFRISATSTYRVTEGRIAESWAQFDVMGVMRQIGPEAAATEDANLALARRAIEAHNTPSFSGLDGVYAADYVHHDDGLPTAVTRTLDEYRANVAPFPAAFPDFRLTLEDAFASGDRVACRWSFRGTQTGPLMHLPASGRPVDVSANSILRIANGRVVEGWVNFDFVAMMQQLGAMG